MATRAMMLRSLTSRFRRSLFSPSRSISTLVLGEHEDGKVRIPSLSAVEAAKRLGEANTISILLAGSGPSLQQAATHSSLCYPSISQVLVVDSDKFDYPLAETWAKLIQLVQRKWEYSHVIAASDSFGKNILARGAALLDVSPITDVIEISGSHTFIRPIYAGNALCTVKYCGVSPCMLTIRSTSFPLPSTAADLESTSAPITQVDISSLDIHNKSRFLNLSSQASERPDLGNARIVVTGGRALKSAENFKMIEKLAEKLSAAGSDGVYDKTSLCSCGCSQPRVVFTF